MHDRRARLGRARSRDLPLRRERQSADARATISRRFSNQHDLGGRTRLEIPGQPLSAQLRARVLVVRLSDARTCEPLDDLHDASLSRRRCHRAARILRASAGHSCEMWLLRRLVQLFRLDQVRPTRPVRPVRPDRPVEPVRLAAYNTYDARSVLSQLISRTASGEEIVIARSGVPLAKLVPYGGEPLRPGLIRTHLVVSKTERRSTDQARSAYEMSSSSDPSGSRK
jgi:antitoxin (DNA-binding transcriptional repressor) of toxin-antitoxin stability system